MINLSVNRLLLWTLLLAVQSNFILAGDSSDHHNQQYSMISKIPSVFLQKVIKSPSRLYSFIDDFTNLAFSNDKKSNKHIACSEIVYKTEESIVEIIVRELLNNMYINTYDETQNGMSSCKKIQIWLENLIQTFKSKQCDNVYLNNKLFDIVGVLCKHTDMQIQMIIENFKNVIKPNEQLINECIEDVIKGDFNNGERKLKLISNDHSVSYVVDKIYTSDPENNFNKVLKFFNTVGNARKCYIAYKYLYDKLENLVNVDVWKLYDLYGSINKIINYKTYPQIDPDVYYLRTKIRDQLVSFMSTELFRSYQDEYSPILHETNVFIDIYKNCKPIYSDGFKLFLSKVCHNSTTCNAVELMSFARRRNFYGEIILGLEAITVQMELNDNEMYTLGQHIRNLSTIKYKSSQRIKLEELKQKLPDSTKNLFFAQRICIRNVGHNEYITIGDDLNENFHSHVKNVQLNHLKVGNVIWNLKWKNNYSYNDEFYINTEVYNNFRLSVECNDSMNDCNIVSRKSMGFNMNELWKIESIGSYAYIKNVGLNAFIFVNDENEIVLFRPGLSYISTKTFQWSVEDCSKYTHTILTHTQ